jgi:hypothetical protein
MFMQSLRLTCQAAAYGLPMVATQNGGPVDIHRVLLRYLGLHFALNLWHSGS